MIIGAFSGMACLLMNFTLENKRNKLQVNPMFRAITVALCAFFPKRLKAIH